MCTHMFSLHQPVYKRAATAATSQAAIAAAITTAATYCQVVWTSGCGVACTGEQQ